ncbi:MAG: hypothetical protein FVQ82_02965 [Planctomycetes bacterium]|nr:hypothetical protein [Planctomycetota bacterium]
MEEQKNIKLKDLQQKALLQTHQLFLEALRHREQDVLRFLAILGPAIAALIFLHSSEFRNDALIYVLGMYAVLFVLMISCVYTIALGYNFRYLTLQLAKFESSKFLDIEKSMLKRWPRCPEKFLEYQLIKCIPWCDPPGNIKVFYWASLFVIICLSIVKFLYSPGDMSSKLLLAWKFYPFACLGGIIFSLLQPYMSGRKLRKAVIEEQGEW